MKETKENIGKKDRNKEKINIEENKYVLETINYWISNADTKISISCGILTIVLTIITFGAENILGKLAKGVSLNCCILLIFKLVAFAACIAFLVSIWFYINALNPNLTSNNSKSNKTCYSLFYGDIMNFESCDKYVKLGQKITKETYNQELLKEIYLNSRICAKKMKNFKIGMWSSVISILLAILSSILYYLAIIFH